MGAGVLFSVDATSPRDAWAVGTRKSREDIARTGPGPPLIEHWDGTRWRIVASADQGTKLSLNDVSITRTGEIWAVGERPYLRGNRCVERSSGGGWLTVPLPAAAACSVDAVDALSSRDIWIDSFSFKSGYRLLRWDGRSWHATGRLPDLTSDCCGPAAITALSARDVWAAGTWGDVSRGYYGTYVAHWDGARWKRVHAPLEDSSSQAEINDISAASARDVWAVGVAGPDGSALVEHYACSA